MYVLLSVRPSTSAKPVMARFPNVLVALASTDIFQMTLKFSLLTLN